MSAYFVTSTGTGIGKTFTTCALLHAARTGGRSLHAYKPVISGWDERYTTDTVQIITASGGIWEVDDISPWRFAAPLSPHRAAAREGKAIAMDALIAWSNARAAEPATVLIEGVGGVMAPLTDSHTVLDWMQALRLPVILTVGSYLGAISHTLTALAALEQVGLRVVALVMNESADADVDFVEAQAGLAPFISTIGLRIFQPRVSSWAEATEIARLLPQL